MEIEPDDPDRASATTVPSLLKAIFIGVAIFAVVGVVIFIKGNEIGCRLKKTPNQATVYSLEMAVGAFEREYGRLPDVGSQRMTTDSREGVHFLKILLGMEDDSGPRQNPRNIKFFAVREGKSRRNGLIYTPDDRSVEGLFDSYGNGFTVILNPAENEPLRFNHGGMEIQLEGRSSAACSPGKDGKLGTGDDVKTW